MTLRLMVMINPPWSGTVIDRWTEDNGVRRTDTNGEYALVADLIDDRFVNLALFRWHARMQVWVVESVLDIYADAYRKLASTVSQANFPP
jgi:hypothetical protein